MKKKSVLPPMPVFPRKMKNSLQVTRRRWIIILGIFRARMNGRWLKSMPTREFQPQAEKNVTALTV
jgi:hypothetical protein